MDQTIMSFFSENPVTISIAGGLVAATFTFRYASKLFNRQPATALITQPEEPTPAEPNVDAKTWPYATYAYNKEQDGPFYKWIDKHCAEHAGIRIAEIERMILRQSKEDIPESHLDAIVDQALRKLKPSVNDFSVFGLNWKKPKYVYKSFKKAIKTLVKDRGNLRIRPSKKRAADHQLQEPASKKQHISAEHENQASPAGTSAEPVNTHAITRSATAAGIAVPDTMVNTSIEDHASPPQNSSQQTESYIPSSQEQPSNNSLKSFYLPQRAGDYTGWTLCIPSSSSSHVDIVRSSSSGAMISLKDIFYTLSIRTMSELRESEYAEVFVRLKKQHPELRTFDFRSNAAQWIPVQVCEQIAISLRLSRRLVDLFALCRSSQPLAELNCRLCGHYTAPDLKLLLSHLDSEHDHTNFIPPTCVCGHVYEDFARLRRHQNNCGLYKEVSSDA